MFLLSISLCSKAPHPPLQCRGNSVWVSVKMSFTSCWGFYPQSFRAASILHVCGFSDINCFRHVFPQNVRTMRMQTWLDSSKIMALFLFYPPLVQQLVCLGLFLPQPFTNYCQLSFKSVLFSLCYWQKSPGNRCSFILKLFVLFEAFLLTPAPTFLTRPYASTGCYQLDSVGPNKKNLNELSSTVNHLETHQLKGQYFVGNWVIYNLLEVSSNCNRE